MDVVHGRTRTLALMRRKLFAVDARGAVVVDENPPEPFRITAVDLRGRALGVLNGRFVRRDTDGVWRVVM
jgi:hypothetical protein